MRVLLATLHNSLPVVDAGDEDGRLHYYQGLHDLAALVLLNLTSKTLSAKVLANLVLYHQRDFVRPTFDILQRLLSATFMPLLTKTDEEVHDFLYGAGVEEVPTFAMSWIIGWFGHDLVDLDAESRLFDAFLAGHALMPVYLSVVKLMHLLNRCKVLTTDCNFTSLHVALSSLPREMMKLQRKEEGEEQSFKKSFRPVETNRWTGETSS